MSSSQATQDPPWIASKPMKVVVPDAAAEASSSTSIARAQPPSSASPGLDIDTLIKVFKHTLFSPFFAFFVPLLYASQRGFNLENPKIFWSGAWFVFVTVIRLFGFSSNKWRNGSLFKLSERVPWEDQIVLITGGGSGIGELLANTLAVRNVTVVVLDIKDRTFENENISFFRCDVGDWSSVQSIAQKIIKEVGHPTIIINNAGVVQGKSILDLDEKDARQTMNVNVLAHFWTLKAFLPRILEKGTGHVVTVSSVLGFVGAARVADYSASKHALVGLHESLRYELDHLYRKPRVRTTLLAPGYMATPMFSKSGYAAVSNPSLALPKPALPLPAAVFNFLAPALSPNDVVKQVIAALDTHESRDILLPSYVGITRAVVGIVPTWGRDFLQWISGADVFMSDFVKVSGRRSDEGDVPTTRSSGSEASSGESVQASEKLAASWVDVNSGRAKTE